MSKLATVAGQITVELLSPWAPKQTQTWDAAQTWPWAAEAAILGAALLSTHFQDLCVSVRLLTRQIIKNKSEEFPESLYEFLRQSWHYSEEVHLYRTEALHFRLAELILHRDLKATLSNFRTDLDKPVLSESELFFFNATLILKSNVSKSFLRARSSEANCE